MRKTIIAFLMLLFGLSAVCAQGSLVQQGKNQLKNRQYATAFSTFKKAAASGNAEAMYYVGLCHENGYGTSQDIYEAMEWYVKSADKGNGEACFRVSKAYYDCNVVGCDREKSAKYARMSALAGNARGEEWYAQCLAGGIGVEKNLDEARRYFEKSAAKGCVDAYCTMAECYSLGVYGFPYDSYKANLYLEKVKADHTARGYNQLACMYQNGAAGVKSEREAYNLFLKSAEMGEANSEYRIGRMYRDGTSDGSVPKSDQQAISWFEKAYRHGYTTAAYHIGLIYSEQGNYPKALEWYYKSGGCSISVYTLLELHRNELSQSDVLAKLTYMAKKNSLREQQLLGDMYYGGTGVAQSYAEAFKWYKAAANNPYCSSVYGYSYNSLGVMYFDGTGVTRNYTEAVKWYRKGAECEFYSDWAQYNLAICYFQGLGVAADANTGFKWMLRSAQQDNVQAMNYVAGCYLVGRGTAKSDYNAYTWIKKSADKGNAEGLFGLSMCYIRGIGVQQNATLGRDYLTKSANKGYKPAQDALNSINRQQSAGGYTSYQDMYSNWVNSSRNLGKDIKFDFSNLQYINFNNIPDVSSGSTSQTNYNANSNSNTTYTLSCKYCGGDGRCRGYGFTTAYMRLHCAGTGKCSECYGKGYTHNPYGGTMKCPQCGGDGKCKQCHGTGICQRCGGSGKGN